jgi:hypothetical protein
MYRRGSCRAGRGWFGRDVASHLGGTRTALYVTTGRPPGAFYFSRVRGGIDRSYVTRRQRRPDTTTPKTLEARRSDQPAATRMPRPKASDNRDTLILARASTSALRHLLPDVVDAASDDFTCGRSRTARDQTQVLLSTAHEQAIVLGIAAGGPCPARPARIKPTRCGSSVVPWSQIGSER